MTSESITKIALLGLAAILSVLAARAYAADTERYLVEYRAYNAALESGDAETAVTHAIAAWKAAEEALGDHRLTGILAYNYGRLVIFSATEQAAAAVRRASELSQAGLVELPQGRLRLYLAYVESTTSGFEKGPADDLREALNAAGMEDAELVGETAPMWLRLAAADIANREYREAVKSAANAEAAIRKANPDDGRKLAEAIVLGAVARIAPRSRNVDTVEAAMEQFRQARRLFPPQKDLDSFDPLLAQVLTWHYATWNVWVAMYEAKGRRPPVLEDDGSPRAPRMFQSQGDGLLKCDDVEWQERESPRYPPGALVDGYLGAVMLGYRLGEDLKVHDARILAEVPLGERFGKYSLAALSEWRAKSLPSGGPECNLVTFIDFVID